MPADYSDPSAFRRDGVTRRQFLVGFSSAGLLAVLVACSPAAQPAPTTASKATEAPKPAATSAPAAAATQAPKPATQAPAVTAAPAATVKKGGTITLARTARITNFNPLYSARGHFALPRPMYNALVRLDQNLQPKPDLAESWQLSPDGLTMALKLRQGVKFHSGRDFTSEDVKITWQWACDAQNAAMLRTVFLFIKDVKTPDKYSVELKFDRPCPMVYDALDALWVLDKTKIDALPNTDAGTGPYMVEKYVPPDEVYCTRFPDYWDKGKPYIDKYVLKSIPDESALSLNLESKALDGIWAPPYQDVARLKTQPGYVVNPGLAVPSNFVVMTKVTVKPFDNKKVRQAINHCIDRERIVKTVTMGLTEPTWLHWTKGSWAYFPDMEGRYKYDLEKAKQLLAEAGYANGFETTMTLSKQVNPPQFGIGQIVQGDLAKVGIKAKIEDVESTLYTKRIQGGEYEMAVNNYGRINRDPSTMMNGNPHFRVKSEAGSHLGYENAEYVAWRDEAATITDQEKRKALFRKIQEFLLEESFMMPVTWNQSFWIYRDYVKDLTFNSEWSPYVGDAWLDK